MKLSAIISALRPYRVRLVQGSNPQADPEVTGIYCRSDRVAPGGIFVAIRGRHTDGREFAADAVRRGACAVIAEKPVAVSAPVVCVADARQALAEASCEFYDHPSRRLLLIGVTGTNGKTTTVCLLERILTEAGFKTGVIGTIDCHFGETVIAGSLTTPEAPDLQERLARMADAGVTHVIMEVSSHGVVQKRIHGCRFKMGIFTNLSQDHLDFHGTMDAYRAAKTRFFTHYMGENATAVINCDTPEGSVLRSGVPWMEIITVGTSLTGAAAGKNDYPDVRADNLCFDQESISGRMVLPSGAFAFSCPIVGRFNLENILCATGGAHALGVPPAAIRTSLAGFSNVPGRLEKIGNHASRHVFVDYSHTPDALENVLGTLRSIVPGRLICIFGCGGDRDRGKRPKMGRIAASLADLVIVTSDNPRTEPPERIISDILEGVRKTGSFPVSPDNPEDAPGWGRVIVEPDRSSAIRRGIRISLPGDGILVAGKGHETYQILASGTIDFDDRAQAEKALVDNGMK